MRSGDKALLTTPTHIKSTKGQYRSRLSGMDKKVVLTIIGSQRSDDKGSGPNTQDNSEKGYHSKDDGNRINNRALTFRHGCLWKQTRKRISLISLNCPLQNYRSRVKEGRTVFEMPWGGYAVLWRRKNLTFLTCSMRDRLYSDRHDTPGLGARSTSTGFVSRLRLIHRRTVRFCLTAKKLPFQLSRSMRQSSP